MATVLVAGAAGLLGRQILVRAIEGGHRGVALIHRTTLPPDLEARCAGIRRGDALGGTGLDHAMAGVDVVVSSVGASLAPDLRGWRPYTRVDTPANLNLLRAAERAGVGRFVYVGVAAHEQLGHLAYVQAHEAVVESLRASRMDHTVVRGTGFFGAFAALLPLARRGRLPLIGDGSALSNPIHEADLAEYIVRELDAEPRERTVGGPEILTRKEISELAFDAVGRPPRFMRTRAGTMRRGAAALRPFHPRMSQLLSFVAAISVTDVLAPHYGSRVLADYLELSAVSSFIST